MSIHAAESWLGEPDAAIEEALVGHLRRQAVKFASADAFRRHGWEGLPAPRIEAFWKATANGPVPSPDPYLWDLREALLHEEPAWLNAILLWRRLRKFGAEYIGGMETSGIPIAASVLAVNRVMHAPPLKAFYLRKERKKDGLRRVLEGARPVPGASIVAVDDLLNKGISKRALVDYCRANDLKLKALLVTVDTGKAGRALFENVCPVESIFPAERVLGRGKGRRIEPRAIVPASALGAAGIDRVLNPMPARDDLAPPPVAPPPVALRPEPVRIEVVAPPPSVRPAVELPMTADMRREDVELVRLARDAVTFTALSGGKVLPTVGDDERGSAGWRAFLGEYLERRGPVFTRISKREFKDGRWFNRMRGCECVGLMDPKPGTFAEMTIRSVVATATRGRKIVKGAPVFHKPVWPSEVGGLSVFVYVVEELRETKARTADELREEGHDISQWGLVGVGERHRGVICSDLAEVKSVEHQLRAVAGKMQNADGIQPHEPGALRFLRMRGRWLWDPMRPKDLYF